MSKSLCVLLLIWLSACSGGDASIIVQRDLDSGGSESCAQCHAKEAELWRGSHHDLAMQHATPDTVVGNFGAEALTWTRGDEVLEARFRQEGDTFFMEIEGGTGPGEFAILYTFGVEPLQQYLVEFPGGALQCLPVAWDTQEHRWFHLDEATEPGDAMHWTGRMQRWNMMCAECHSTGLDKGYDGGYDSYQTTFTELDVGCIACHGDAAAHARAARNWSGQGSMGSLNYGFGEAGDPAQLEVENCAHCHSRRSSLTQEWAPGEAFLDHFNPTLLSEDLYFADGQIKDEVYVWGSFTQSRMHAAGVTCSDCHDPHSLKLKLPEGPGHNELCLQCHSTGAPLDRFPTMLPKNYDSPEHHGHVMGSEAARCTTCHMPERTYMQVDERRDHRMGVPRPDLSASLGTPNACATCHESNRDDAWAAAAITEWLDRTPRTSRIREQRDLDTLIATTFTGAWNLGRATPLEREALYGDLLSIFETADVSSLHRATALDLLANFGTASMGVITEALEHPDALVRVTAALAIRRLPQTGALGLKLRDLHGDPVGAVRVAAATPADFGRYLIGNADFPSSHFERGLWDQAQGRFADAERSWRRTLELDPGFMPAVYNLSVLLSALQRGPEAGALLQEAVAHHPEEGELHYSLALQLAELQNNDGALVAFERAAELLPERPRISYNLGLMYSKVGKVAEAELALRRCIQLHYDNGLTGGDFAAADATYALALLLLDSDRLAEARELVQELEDLGIPGAVPLGVEIEKRELEANGEKPPK